jgi:hypothetical protein
VIDTHEGAHLSKALAVVANEIREALPAMLFFLIAFHMIAITKTVILDDYKISGASATIATVAALIVAKAILIVEKLPVARLFTTRMLYNILWKTLLFGAVTLLFRFLEEFISLIAKHEGSGMAIRQLFGEISWPHFWMIQMWLFSLLFLYCLASELVRAIGAAKVKAMLLTSNDGQ